MKRTRFAALLALTLIIFSGMAWAGANNVDREQSCPGKMMHKLGRGVTNVFTCWVEVPRNIAIEWQKTDPATGFCLGMVTGIGWGFARFATGVYESVTFPFPIPPDYLPMMQPEFVVTDVWGAPIPDVTEFKSNDPNYPEQAPIYPQRFNY